MQSRAVQATRSETAGRGRGVDQAVGTAGQLGRAGDTRTWARHWRQDACLSVFLVGGQEVRKGEVKSRMARPSETVDSGEMVGARRSASSDHRPAQRDPSLLLLLLLAAAPAATGLLLSGLSGCALALTPLDGSGLSAVTDWALGTYVAPTHDGSDSK